MRAPEDAREEISRAVVSAGLGLLRMEPVSTGLEAVFLKLSAGDGGAHDAEDAS